MELMTSQGIFVKLPAREYKPQPRVNDCMMMGLPIIRLEDAYLHAITEEQTIQIVLDELDRGHGGCVVTMNLDHMRRYNEDEAYRDLAAKATLHVADGMPLVWASRLQGTPLPERVTGSNLILSLTAAAEKAKRSVFLVGGAPGTATAAGEILKQQHPDLIVAGSLCPPIGFENDQQQMADIRHQIIEAAPDIVYVALGSPKQDRLIEELRDYLPSVWWIGVGISFSFITGQVARAPKWMQDLGFEWLHRLSQEPTRLATRYLVHGLPYCLKMCVLALWQKMVHQHR